MFIRFELGLRHHHKVHALSKALLISRAEALGTLALLWANALELAPDGDISNWGVDGVALHCGWEGEANLRDALVATGWLDRDGDTVTIHNWRERNDSLRITQKRESAKIRKRESRKKHSKKVVTSCHSDACDSHCDACDGHTKCHERGEERRSIYNTCLDHSTDLDNSEGTPPPPGFLASLGIPESEDK